MSRTGNKSKFDDVIDEMVASGMFRVTEDGYIETCYQWRACKECIVPWFRCDRRDGSGYYYVSFRRARVKSHRLAYALYTGTHLQGLEINHLDGNRVNNRRENLELCDAKRNSDHAYEIGLNTARGERHRHAKLTEAAVVEARKLAALGVGYAKLSRVYGVSAVAMRLACIGKTWSHVKEAA